MKLDRLRIVGFKTFAEPTEVSIRPGLTGVVGPNGCGKSNLVEALRWVMGESSHRNLRASGMDEVIFSGSAGRPARNMAEVTLAIDNADRTAPAAFNDADEIEVSRRIERDRGSTYHVNGREVRARDVQLLFADAASGARSPALVRQGQISELIQAKPQARRRILEDAAGIAGLHARRHEAELKLKQAHDNLVRVEDVLREISLQADHLRRQDRHAARYRTMSAEIRRLEAQVALAAYRSARDDLAAAEAARRREVEDLEARRTEQATAARHQAVTAHSVQGLRAEEAESAAELRRCLGARSELDHEEQHASERRADLDRRIGELGRDGARHALGRQDADQMIARLEAEAADLGRSSAARPGSRASLEDASRAADRELAEAEAALAAIRSEWAGDAAARHALEAEHRAETDRASRATAEMERTQRERTALEGPRADPSPALLRTARDTAAEAARAAEDAAAEVRARLSEIRTAEAARRAGLVEADRAADRLEAEVNTIARLLAAAPSAGFPTMLDAVIVAPGYEAALAAALGDDLEASSQAGAPLMWSDTGPGDQDPALPPGATPLSDKVSGPPALARRLRQIGLVARDDAPSIVARLRPGQRLVTREGHLWRWDGLSATSGAPSAAAARLAERNRLGRLEQEAGAARQAAAERRAEALQAEAALQAAIRAEAAGVEEVRRTRRALDQLTGQLAQAERREAESAARLSALAEALARIATARQEAETRAAAAARSLSELGSRQSLNARLEAAQAHMEAWQAAARDAGAALGALKREEEMTAARLSAIAAEIRLWSGRADRATAAGSEIADALAEARTEREGLTAAPESFQARRRALAGEIASAETRSRHAAEQLAQAEATLREAERTAHASLEVLAAARERRASSEARAEALARGLADLTHRIAETFDADPAALARFVGPESGPAPPEAGAIDTRLAALRADRDRLGPVNLRAAEELAEADAKQDRLASERDDLAGAIQRLRSAVAGLNREGRERLAAAFGIVNGHFGRLFKVLFGGGEAELILIDSDDPLEAGLEITARPPGKAARSLALLSGGEQALTATALIFAVFLTNPSPLCVLDEVDAPLDDANVERYCDLLVTVAREAATRFIVITHNPITMARMDRLFGVTMAERGVSQLVSVDLESAERVRDVG